MEIEQKVQLIFQYKSSCDLEDKVKVTKINKLFSLS